MEKEKTKEESQKELEDIIRSPRKFMETFLYIIDKNANLVKFKLNKPQSKVMDYVEECLEKKKPIRVRILKARQMGFSTFISGLGNWWATMNLNSSYAVVAHKADSTVAIFEKNKIFYNHLPDAMKPKTDKFNSEQISYEGLLSKIFFGTAGGNELFRGETILFLHKSEKAFWENERMLNKSLNACVPNKPFTAIFDESTANGYNHYKDEWDMSVRGEGSYKAFFFGWNEMDEYQEKVEEGFKLLPIEEEYMLVHDLTMEQMRWRRKILTDSFSYSLKDIELDDIDDFKQEYPLTPEEAFISSGQGVFNSKIIKKGLEYSNNTKYERMELNSIIMDEPLMVYEKPEIIEKTKYFQKVEFNYEKNEYEYIDTDIPLETNYLYANYLIAIDTSGLGQDNNVITVWHTNKKKKVAQWIRKNISEENLAKVAVEIAKIYNNGMIAPEVNYSHSLTGFIENLGYKNMYIMESETRIDKKKSDLEYGWKTTITTKPIIISTMRKCLNEDYTICPDKEFWREAEYYLRQKTKSNNDTYNAAPGKHDDVVMSSMIGRYLCDSFMVEQGYTKKNKKEETNYESNKKVQEGSFEDILGIGKKNKKGNGYINYA